MTCVIYQRKSSRWDNLNGPSSRKVTGCRIGGQESFLSRIWKGSLIITVMLSQDLSLLGKNSAYWLGVRHRDFD